MHNTGKRVTPSSPNDGLAAQPTPAQRANFNSQKRRECRDIARDVWAAYRAVAQAAGYLPIEIRTAEAITLCHYEVTGQDYDKRRNIKLLLIGAVLSSYGKTDDGKVNTASNRTSHFFINAQPRTGYQLLTRYKATKENQSHEYADHIMPVAEMVAAYHADERATILKDGQGQKQARIHAARELLAAEALILLPKCDAELLDAEGEVYAYLPDAEAQAYAAKNPNFRAQAKTTKRKRPLVDADFKRLTQRIRDTIDDILTEAQERNGLPDANEYSHEAERAAMKAFSTWRKTAPASEIRVEERDRELIHVSGIGGQGANEPTEPCCQFDPVTGRCTGPQAHHKEGACKGKKPLVKGKKDAKPGDGHTAASRDKGLITEWYTKTFRNAGVAIRLDNSLLGDCILVDPNIKDGGRGIESYTELSDTFALPETLTAITPSGGHHHIFKLPEGLPADYLGSWTRVFDSAGFPDIDIKVARKGLAHVEPTVGKLGVYRWVDATAEIATLPREFCDYTHEVHEREQQAKLEKSKAAASTHSASDDAQPFDPADDQAKYFKDAPNGSRRPRLRSIACALAARGANEAQIVSVLNYHDGRFTQPTNDTEFISRVARGAVQKFAPEVTR